jgi:hypothetical protein
MMGMNFGYERVAREMAKHIEPLLHQAEVRSRREFAEIIKALVKADLQDNSGDGDIIRDIDATLQSLEGTSLNTEEE